MPWFFVTARASIATAMLLGVCGAAHAQQSRLPECPAFHRFFKWTGCIGSATLPKGEKYTGEFRNDKPNGQGSSTLANGSTYSGTWLDGEHHGRGQLIFSSGSKYVGEFSYGLQSGKGTYSWPNGDKYVGAFSNGLRQGVGTFTWADGTKYTGEFQQDVRHGKGTYIWANGKKYVGEFRNSMSNGEGVLYARNGTILQKGEWKDDQFCGVEKCYSVSLLTPAERMKADISAIDALLVKGDITYAETWRRGQKTHAKYGSMTSQPDQEFFAVAIEAGSRLDKALITKERYDVEIQKALTARQIQQRQISAAENAEIARLQRQINQDRANTEMIQQQTEMIRQQNEAARRDSAIRALGIAGSLAQPTIVTPPVSNTPAIGVPHNYNINGKPITCTNMGAVTNCQ